MCSCQMLPLSFSSQHCHGFVNMHTESSFAQQLFSQGTVFFSCTCVFLNIMHLDTLLLSAELA